jgi:large subunit ribosomal protein L16
MLSPRRTKFRKLQRGSFSNTPSKQADLLYGYIALKTLQAGEITARQIESARRAMVRKYQRKGRLWIRIFPDISVTAKPSEVRMGKGKGSPQYWVARVKPGQILFELALPLDSKGKTNRILSREVLSYGAGKLPVQTSIIET